MQPTHYDIDKIEAGIRKMFGELPAPINTQQSLQMKQVELTVAFERFKYVQLNEGHTDEDICGSLLTFMADRISDFAGGRSATMEQRMLSMTTMINFMLEHLNSINDRIKELGPDTSATGFVDIQPIIGGNA